MSREGFPLIGNDMVVTQSQLQMVTPLATAAPAPLFIIPLQAISSEERIPVTVTSSKPKVSLNDGFGHFLDVIHEHSVIVFALLFLLVAGTGIKVGAAYWSAHIALVKPVVATKSVVRPLTGLNMAVSNSQLQAELQRITSQPASLNLGAQTVTVDAGTLKSWLKITADHKTNMDYLHVDGTAISASLSKLADKYAVSPVNQVTVTHPDGTSLVIVGGKNGTKLSDTADLTGQSQQIAKNLFGGKGFQVSAPLVSVPFQSVTGAGFNKLIEVNLVQKQMWLYENGTFVRQYAVSAGKPSTPTPIGEFRIYSKFATEDMKGTNPDGTPYFQPHVHWVNYFLPGGYAVHGVYWHPLSWFGNINSSHGCVGLPDAEAEWVYDWAPIGTTVITHN